MSDPARAVYDFDSAAMSYASSDGSIEGGDSARDGEASRGSKTGGSGGFVASTICLFLRVGTLRAVGTGGGCTGARGGGGMLVRGTTGGGGCELAGWPSASRNLRIRSSSDSTGARSIGSTGDGLVVDLRSESCCVFFASPALLASNLNNTAIAISRMKRRFSMCMLRRR
jgi:hypothetical protein